jgi:E3 ubiquitin-protein ligase synoviolin
MVKFIAYALTTLTSTAGMLFYAYFTREQQFFPAAVWVATNKFCIMLMGNLALMLVIAFGRLIKWIFLGKLREPEVETLVEKSRFAVFETFLALMIFKDELDVEVATLFTSLMFAKTFHW